MVRFEEKIYIRCLSYLERLNPTNSKVKNSCTIFFNESKDAKGIKQDLIYSIRQMDGLSCDFIELYTKLLLLTLKLLTSVAKLNH
jgi:hypothetical protein